MLPQIVAQIRSTKARIFRLSAGIGTFGFGVGIRRDLDGRLDAIAESLEAREADEEAETLAAERIRSGAAKRTQDGAEAL
jgi:hypothetical protein